MDGDNDDDEASSEECDIKEIDEHYQRPTPPAQVTHTVQHTVQHNEHEAPDDDSDGEPPITEETMAAMLKQPDRSVPERLAKNKRTNASLTRRQLQITEKKWIQIRRAGIGHYVTENLDALSAKGLPKSWRYKNPTHVHNAIDKLEKQFPILAKAEDSWAAIYVLRSHASNISEDVSRRSRAQTTEGSAASASPSPTTVAAAPTPTAQHATTHKVTQHPHAHADSTGAHYEVRQKQTNIKVKACTTSTKLILVHLPRCRLLTSKANRSHLNHARRTIRALPRQPPLDALQSTTYAPAQLLLKNFC